WNACFTPSTVLTTMTLAARYSLSTVPSSATVPVTPGPGGFWAVTTRGELKTNPPHNIASPADSALFMASSFTDRGLQYRRGLQLVPKFRYIPGESTAGTPQCERCKKSAYRKAAPAG